MKALGVVFISAFCGAFIIFIGAVKAENNAGKMCGREEREGEGKGKIWERDESWSELERKNGEKE